MVSMSNPIHVAEGFPLAPVTRQGEAIRCR